MKSTIKNLKIVLKIAEKYRKVYFISLITTVVQMTIGVILPLLMARQIVFLTDSVYTELILASLMVLCTSLLNELNEFIMSLLCRKFRIGTIKNLQMKLRRRNFKNYTK